MQCFGGQAVNARSLHLIEAAQSIIPVPHGHHVGRCPLMYGTTDTNDCISNESFLTPSQGSLRYYSLMSASGSSKVSCFFQHGFEGNCVRHSYLVR
jgi:hypothetical protein